MGSVVKSFEGWGESARDWHGDHHPWRRRPVSWLCAACRSEVRCQSSRCRAASHKPKSQLGLGQRRCPLGKLGGLRQVVPPHAREFRDEVFLGVNISGMAVASQGGREHNSASRRRRSVFECGSGVYVEIPRSSQFLGLRLPHRALTPFVPNLDRDSMRLIPGQTHSLRLLVDYLCLLGSSQVPRSTQLDRAISIHILDLIALSVGARQDAATEAQHRGMRAARLQAIKADVASHFSEEELSVAAVATRHSVTPRYIHKLFETEGVTFSEYVLASPSGIRPSNVN